MDYQHYGALVLALVMIGGGIKSVFGFIVDILILAFWISYYEVLNVFAMRWPYDVVAND